MHSLAVIWDEYDDNNTNPRAERYVVVKRRHRTRHDDDELGHSYEEWIEDPNGVETMVLLWGGDEGTALPYKMNMEQSAKFLYDWLEQTDHGPEPDQDGSNKKGWRLFTQAWGHVYSYRYAIIGIKPEWMMYGK